MWSGSSLMWLGDGPLLSLIGKMEDKMLGSVVIGGLNVVLYCAIVIFIAFCIVWAFKLFGVIIDPDVFKWGRVIVGLICLIVIVGWLLGLLGFASYGPPPIIGYR